MDDKDKLDEFSDKLESLLAEYDVKFMLTGYTGTLEQDEKTVSKTVLLKLAPISSSEDPSLDSYLEFVTYKHTYVMIRQSVEKMSKEDQDQFWEDVAEKLGSIKEKDKDFKGVIH